MSRKTTSKPDPAPTLPSSSRTLRPQKPIDHFEVPEPEAEGIWCSICNKECETHDTYFEDNKEIKLEVEKSRQEERILTGYSVSGELEGRMITSFILRGFLSRFAYTIQHLFCQLFILEEGEDFDHPGPVQHPHEVVHLDITLQLVFYYVGIPGSVAKLRVGARGQSPDAKRVMWG